MRDRHGRVEPVVREPRRRSEAADTRVKLGGAKEFVAVTAAVAWELQAVVEAWSSLREVGDDVRLGLPFPLFDMFAFVGLRSFFLRLALRPL